MQDERNPVTPGEEPVPVFHADAADADWIKGDKVRLGDDGAIYVRDLSVPGGTRRVVPGEPDYDELRARAEEER